MVQTSSYKINPGDGMYSMVTVVNVTMLYICKLLREILKVSSHTKILTMCSDGC